MNGLPLIPILALALCTACGDQPSSTSTPAPETPAPKAQPAKAPTPAAQPAEAPRTTWLFVGDSLTAGFGVEKPQAFPALLGERFKADQLPWQVRNAGVSGETSAGVLRRLDWLLTPDVHTVFLATGANDGLRGQPVEALEKNLTEAVKIIRGKGARVILAGMQMPPNLGPEYIEAFQGVYPRVAKATEAPLMPFLLAGVAGEKALNQADGIHPNPEGHQKVADQVAAFLTEAKLMKADP